MKSKLIYLIDPHCGWCHANGANIEFVYKTFQNQLEFEVLTGGMWMNENAPNGGLELNEFIRQQAPRLKEKTGISIGEPYFTLVSNPDYTFSSFEPSAAIQAIKTMYPEKALAFSKLVQKAIFVYGKPLDKLDTYLSILDLLEMDGEWFEAMWLSEDNKAKTLNEIEFAQGFSTGFPALILQQNHKYYRIATGYFEGRVVVNGLNEFLVQSLVHP